MSNIYMSSDSDDEVIAKELFDIEPTTPERRERRKFRNKEKLEEYRRLKKAAKKKTRKPLSPIAKKKMIERLRKGREAARARRALLKKDKKTIKRDIEKPIVREENVKKTIEHSKDSTYSLSQNYAAKLAALESNWETRFNDLNSKFQKKVVEAAKPVVAVIHKTEKPAVIVNRPAAVEVVKPPPLRIGRYKAARW